MATKTPACGGREGAHPTLPCSRLWARLGGCSEPAVRLHKTLAALGFTLLSFPLNNPRPAHLWCAD